MSAKRQIAIHRFEARLFPVNAYLVETSDGVVVVDATLGVSDGRALRLRVEALRKPLAAVIITHSHPDHYGGVTSLLDGADVPIFAVPGVDQVIRRDDAAKEQILRPMFGDEWAATRTFPNRLVQGGERVTIGDAVFAVTDLGPGESPHDSLWRLESSEPARAFVGDMVYGHMHAFLADGFYDHWLANLERAKRELPADTMLFMGHGEPVAGHQILDWQASYIQRFIATLRAAVEREGLQGDSLADAVTSRMKTFLPGDDLLFLLRLSVEPMRKRLGLAARGRAGASMTYGVLGTGTVGQTVAGKLVALGHAVMMGSRSATNPKATGWAQAAGPGARVGTFADAAAFGELLFNCTNGASSLDALHAAGENHLAGKVLVDVANILPPNTRGAESLGEQIQNAFPRRYVVKALNTMNCQVMVDVSKVAGAHSVFMSGNDSVSKAKVRALLESFGWKDVIDLGDITTARGAESYMPLWLALSKTLGTAHFNIKVVR